MSTGSAPLTFDTSSPPGVINFGIGQPSPDLMPQQLLREASNAFLDSADPLELNYGERQSDAGFREALAELLTDQYGYAASPETLIATGGNSQALDFVCGHLANEGDTVFIEEPSYFLAHQIFADHGLKIVGIPIDRDGIRMDVLHEELGRHRPALFYVIPSYHNPCGTSMSTGRREELLQLSRQHDFIIVADEVYQMLHYSEQPPPAFGALAERGNVLSLGSFSKIMAPALRLGWIQATPALMDRILKVGMVNSGGSMNHFTSLVMRQAMQSGQQQALIEKLQAVYGRRLLTMDEALNKHLGEKATWRLPRGGYFFWVKLDPAIDAAALKPLAVRYGTGFQPGSVFSCQQDFRNYLRLSFAHFRSSQIREGIAGLGRLIAENPGIS
jgi:DNA-binding transcriptional MocR family regulator